MAALNRPVQESSMARNRNACAEVYPSAPTCRNSICAVTLPKMVRRSNPASVPCGSGASVWIADPPVRDRRCRTPTNRWSRIVNNTGSRLGTRIRAGRSDLSDAGDLTAILESVHIPEWCGQITQGSKRRYCCNQRLQLIDHVDCRVPSCARGSSGVPLTRSRGRGRRLIGKV